ALPVGRSGLAFGRAIYRHGTVTLRGTLEVRGNTAAHVEGTHQRGGAAPERHGVVFGKFPASGSAQDAAEHSQSGACGKDTGAEGILELPAPTRAPDHPSDSLGIEGIDPRWLAQFGLLHRRTAVDGAATAGAGVEHLLPTRTVVVTTRRVALH